MRSRLPLIALTLFVTACCRCEGDQKAPCPRPGLTTNACWIRPDNKTVDLQLYVTGLNHDWSPHHVPVVQVGVDELVDFIAGDALTPDSIVVGISASAPSACTAGTYQHPGEGAFNAQ